MATQRYHLLVLLIMAVGSFHMTCMGFPLTPLIFPRPALPSPSSETTSSPTTDATSAPTSGHTSTSTVSQESGASEEHNSTLTPSIDIMQTTQSPPDTDSGSHSDTVAFQVELIMDINIPPIVNKVKLGQYVVKHPGQFAIGSGLDLINGIFEAPCQGIYYFAVSVHIRRFPSNTENLSGSLAIGVCTNNRCTEGSLEDASLSATVPFQIDGFNTQASGFLQLEKGQSVTILLENTCNYDFKIKASSSLSIFKVI